MLDLRKKSKHVNLLSANVDYVKYGLTVNW